MTEESSTPGAETEQLRGEVASLAELVEQLAASLETERQEVSVAVTSLESSVSALVNSSEGPRGKTDPRAWVDCASAEEWVELADWVDWFNATYDVRNAWRIRPCWPAHLGVAEELAALRSAWREAASAARRKPTENEPTHSQDADSLAFWHDRYLAPTLARLNTMYSMHACSEDRHEDAGTSPRTDRTLIDVLSAADGPQEVGVNPAPTTA